MAGRSELRQHLKGLRHSLRSRLSAASSGRHTSLNISHRANVVINANTGESGSSQSASAHQEADIRQGSVGP